MPDSPLGRAADSAAPGAAGPQPAPGGDRPIARVTNAAPGTEPPRRRPRLRYELLGCGLHGHDLVGTDAASLRPEDAAFARELGGERWYRCLRCDAWVVLPPPEIPTRLVPPDPGQIEVPLRGKPLRDRYVLRTIALERTVHLLVLAALDAAIFAFAADRRSLHSSYTHVLADLQGSLGGPVNNASHGLLSDLNRLFAVKHSTLILIGAGLAVYCAVLLVEMVGLWWASRWAEYLTFLETGVLVPFEIYEMTSGVTALKLLSLLINLAVLAYLAFAHRLFGISGGVAAEEAERARDTGWAPILAATPGGAEQPPPDRS